MRDEHPQTAEALISMVLAEEGRARDCAHHAKAMIQHGNTSSGTALMQMSLRHSATVMGLHSRIAAWTPQKDVTSDRGVLSLRPEERRAENDQVGWL